MTLTKAKENLGTKSPLPPGWRLMRLGDICDINPSRPAGFRRASDALTTFVPMSAVDEHRGVILNSEIRPFSDVAKGYTFFSEGDILFAKITPCMQNGKQAIARGLIDGIGFGSTEFHIIRPRPGVASEWIHRFVRQPHVLSAAANHFTGAVGQQRVPESFLASLEIPLPSIDEQDRIMHILNEQMTAVERARAAAQARLEAAKALPAAYLRAVFESEEAKEWPQRKFDEIAVLQRGYDLPFKNKVAGKYPLVTSSGIAGYHNEFKANAPGVVTGRSGSIGKVYYITEDYWPHNTSLFIRDFKGNVPLYIFYFLQWLNTEKVGSGTGVPTLDRKSVHRLTVGYPDIDTQNHIASTLSQRNAEALKIAKIIERELETINALPAALLQQAFSGGL